MEGKDIRYTGITQAGAELDCNDGDLSISHNIINQDGAMRPVIMPEPEFVLQETEKLLYVHSTSKYKNYILLRSSKYENLIQVYGDGTVVCAYPLESTLKLTCVWWDTDGEYSITKEYVLAAGTYKTEITIYEEDLGDVSIDISEDDIYKYRVTGHYEFYEDSFGGWSEQGISGSDRNRLCLFSPDKPDKREDFYNLNNRELYKVNSIGNTLVILTNQGLVYALYTSGKYEILGANPPFPSISFRLEGAFGKVKSFTVDFKNKTKFYKEVYDPLKEGLYLKKLYLDNPVTSETIYANINPDAEMVRNSGCFQYDFMIRYAYRLYDGSFSMCSVPVFMNAGDGTPYYMKVEDFYSYASEDGADVIGKYSQIHKMEISMYRHFSKLCIQINNSDEMRAEREKWKDVVQEIVFFVTHPLWYMDQSFQPAWAIGIGNFIDFLSKGTYNSIATLSLGGTSEGKKIYSKVDLPSGIDFKQGERVIPLMIKGNAAGNNYEFRRIASIQWMSSDIKDGEQRLEVESGALANLGNMELFEGEYNVGDVLVPRDVFVYNSRLNLINVSAIPFEYPLEACVIYTNGRSEKVYYFNTGYRYFLETYTFKAYVLIESSNANVMVVETSSLPLHSLGTHFFYPNPKAIRVIVERTDKDGKKAYLSRKLEEHKALNGAYTSDLSDQFQEDFDTSVLEHTERGFHYPNKIYTSEVNNPFIFPIEGINTIGVGDIVGISSITKALSQGQFGQFPLLVFATDGIWAMEVSDTGLYSVKQPISRDVCINAGSITQIDGAVVFVSDKGVMIIDGSSVNTLSAELDGNSFQTADIRQLSDVLEKEALTEELGNMIPVKEFMTGCMIAYDYPNGRLMFVHPQKQYAYIYSLYSRTWATVTSDFSGVVTDYPVSYIQGKEGKVIDFSTKINWDDERKVKCTLLSRPLKLDGDMYKTMNYIVNRGAFQMPDKMAVVVFASMDGKKFFPIGSALGTHLSRLQGSAYRYFRILTVGEMSAGESLSVTSLYYTPKWRNKPR